MVFASLILSPIYLSQRERIVLPCGRERWLVALAGVFLAGHFAVWITALTLTSVSSATVLVTIQPLFLTVLAHVILKERVDKWGYLAIVLALTGAALISWGDFRLSEGHLVGDLLALSGALWRILSFDRTNARGQARHDQLHYTTLRNFGAITNSHDVHFWQDPTPRADTRLPLVCSAGSRPPPCSDIRYSITRLSISRRIWLG